MRLETKFILWEIPIVKTLTVDAHKRLRIPDAQPSQVFAYESDADGVITLVPVKAERKLRFPRGSLKKYVTASSDKEMLGILKGCTLEVPE